MAMTCLGVQGRGKLSHDMCYVQVAQGTDRRGRGSRRYTAAGGAAMG